jgi:hypothetical protein
VARVAAAGLLLSAAAGCATLDQYATGETHRLERAPYHRTLARGVPFATENILVMPVAPGERLAESLMYGSRLAEFQPLVQALQDRLAVHYGCCRLLPSAGLPAQGAPRLYVGSALGDDAPLEAESQVFPQDFPFAPMVLHLDRPRDPWREAVRELAAREGASQVLLVTVDVAQYPKSRAGFLGKKIVLGTDHEQRIRFLTAEDKPMEVLQLTGLLLDAEGRVVRAGAEGIIARDTPFLLQAFDIVKVLDDLDLESVLVNERREDRPGRPLKWEAALDALVEQLAARR